MQQPDRLDTAHEWAASAIKRFNLKPPVDLHIVRRSLKLYVRYALMEGGGGLMPSPRRWYAVINTHHSPERQRFSLAHEICEFLLMRHKERTGKLLIKDDAARERFCDRFAVQLLMPEHLVHQAVKELHHSRKNDKTDVLAARFGVSQRAMKIRLKELQPKRQSEAAFWQQCENYAQSLVE